jgi:hypothetical protein
LGLERGFCAYKRDYVNFLSLMKRFLTQILISLELYFQKKVFILVIYICPPPDIPWPIYRIAMSKYFKVSPLKIEERWSLDDVEHVHEALDYMEQLEWIQMLAV